MVPESEWTKSQREFIGTQFPTPKGGILTVNGLKCGNKFYVHCSLCSVDEELWEGLDLYCARGSLIRGSVPCACSKSYRWTKYQYTVIIKRECARRHYEFKGFKGDWLANNTKIILYNKRTNNEWDTTTIASFLAGTGDPLEGSEAISRSRTIQDDKHIQDFYEAGFSKGYKFWRSNKKLKNGYSTSYWRYTCPSCSRDEYVEAGVCQGVFESHVSSLKRGVKSCRCSKNHKWTKSEKEYQIHKEFKTKGAIFEGWGGEYVGAKSRVIWYCNNNHRCNTSVDSLLRTGVKCKYCASEKAKNSGVSYGYYPKRVDEEDFLYIVDFNKTSYFKVGRSFNTEDRFYGSKGLLKQSGFSHQDIKVLNILKGKHQDVWDTEQWLHKELTEKGFHYEGYGGNWSTELFYDAGYSTVCELLKSSSLKDVSEEYKD